LLLASSAVLLATSRATLWDAQGSAGGCCPDLPISISGKFSYTQTYPSSDEYGLSYTVSGSYAFQGIAVFGYTESGSYSPPSLQGNGTGTASESYAYGIDCSFPVGYVRGTSSGTGPIVVEVLATIGDNLSVTVGNLGGPSSVWEKNSDACHGNYYSAPILPVGALFNGPEKNFVISTEGDSGEDAWSYTVSHTFAGGAYQVQSNGTVSICSSGPPALACPPASAGGQSSSSSTQSSSDLVKSTVQSLPVPSTSHNSTAHSSFSNEATNSTAYLEVSSDTSGGYVSWGILVLPMALVVVVGSILLARRLNAR
jgi:hypothetical protein